MDSDSKTQQYKTKMVDNNGINARDVFQSIRFRRIICAHHGLDGFILDYGRRVLWPLGIMLWMLFTALT
jgi:hypothetical protein